jgi:GNAT superfamily N-acetyltransferase
MQTLNKHVKWRIEKKEILICDCKRLIDLKLPLEYTGFMKKLERGFEKNMLNQKEKLAFKDFEKMRLLSNLEIRQIREKEFNNAMSILDKELGKNRVRDKDFVYNKFKGYSQFFIGLFLDNEIIGIICGFPREDYLLISEIAVDLKFHNRGFGKKLVKEFEKRAVKKYNQINAGAEDKAVGFYNSLPDYKPFLLIQFAKKDYSDKNFSGFKFIKKYDFDKENRAIEVEIKNADLNLLNNLGEKYPLAWFQYLFVKKLI